MEHKLKKKGTWSCQWADNTQNVGAACSESHLLFNSHVEATLQPDGEGGARLKPVVLLEQVWPHLRGKWDPLQDQQQRVGRKPDKRGRSEGVTSFASRPHHFPFILQTSFVSSRKFCINLPSSSSLYELQVRSKLGSNCGESIFWSSWSESVLWGSNSSTTITGKRFSTAREESEIREHEENPALQILIRSASRRGPRCCTRQELWPSSCWSLCYGTVKGGLGPLFWK